MVEEVEVKRAEDVRDLVEQMGSQRRRLTPATDIYTVLMSKLLAWYVTPSML